MAFCEQLGLMMKKGVILKFRHPIRLFFEIFIPIIIALALVPVYFTTDPDTYPDSAHYLFPNYQPYPIGDLAAHLEFLNIKIGLVCSERTHDYLKERIDKLAPGFETNIFKSSSLSDEEKQEIQYLTFKPLSEYIVRFDTIDDYRNAVLNDDQSFFSTIVIREFFENNKTFDYEIQFNITAISAMLNSFMYVDNLQRGVDKEGLEKYLKVAYSPFTFDQTEKKELQEKAFFTHSPGFLTFQKMMDTIILYPEISCINNCSPPEIRNSEAFIDYVNTTFLPFYFIKEETAVKYLNAFINISKPFSQSDINEIVIKMHAFKLTKEYKQPTPFISPAPTSGYTKYTFFEHLGGVLGPLLVICYLFPSSWLLRGIAFEKEYKIREGMEMMGLSEATLNLSWILLYFIQFTIQAFILAIVLATMLGFDSFLILFLVFVLYGCSITSFGFFVASFFNTTKSAIIFGLILMLACDFPVALVNQDYITNSSKMGASVLYQVALELTMGCISGMEGAMVPVSFSNINFDYRNYSILNGMIMLLVDTLIYLILGWYFNKVAFREYGIALPFYFPFTKSYWLGSSRSEPKLSTSTNTNKEDDQGDHTHCVGTSDLERTKSDNLGYFEEMNEEELLCMKENRCVYLSNLTKEFDTPDGKKVAVNGLNAQMVENEIFVLLGHNGAGKSTTISMLTGLYSATSGEAKVYNFDMNTEMDKIRHLMSVCPQHDILFEELTVREHLEMYGRIKGIKKENLNNEVMTIIKEIGLTEKVDWESHKLSGGQKRKLSVGIALIGGSKVVFLDEPTSGMDPYSRRSTWNILENNKKGRTIILTTHFMDEADLLGDRIGIMSDGRMICCGRSQFLKQKFGIGYSLTIVKEPNCNSNVIEELVSKTIPDSEIMSNVGKEISFRLPLNSSHLFSNLLKVFDVEKSKYGVSSYGMSATTLEEVFLNTAKLEEISRANSKTSSKSGSFQKVVKPIEFNRQDQENRNMFLKHFAALFQKRLRYALRDVKGLICQIVIPILLLTFGYLLLTIFSFSEPDTLILDTSMYNTRSTNSDMHGKTRFPIAYFDSPPSINITKFLDTDQVVPMSFTLPDISKIDGDICTIQILMTKIDLCKLSEEDINNLGLSGQYFVTTLRASKSLLDLKTNYEDSIYLSSVIFQNNSYLLLANTTSKFSSLIGTNLMNSAILKSQNPSAKLTTRINSLPYNKFQNDIFGSMSSYTSPMIVLLSLAFIPAYYASFLVKEKETNVKHQQIISGVSLPAYWLSTYAWDMITYCVPFLAAIALLYIYDLTAFINNIWAAVLFYLLYGLAIAPSTYFLTYFFKSYSTAQNTVLFLNLFMAILMLLNFALGMLKATCRIMQVLNVIFMIFLPGYVFGSGMMRLSLLENLRPMDLTCDIYHANPADAGSLRAKMTETYTQFQWEGIGQHLFTLGMHVILFIILAIVGDYMLSYPLIHKKCLPDKNLPKREYVDDEDVKKEFDRINNNLPHESGEKESLLVKGLRKVYNGKKIAVEDLNIGLVPGTCFGFLGINGAGKTTTLEILSGDLIPTDGTAKIYDKDILTEQMEVRKLLGYCPQFDSLLDLLTVREHLELFAKIKGVPKVLLEPIVQEKLKQMDLEQFENKKAYSLSGGNKRKLSVAISLIGNPPLLFLDEPSTGMDPVARRHMWDIISDVAIQRDKCTIILTTHSMEEAEALCGLVGIMVGGRLRCFGSVQHLKNRFGKEYMLQVKLNSHNKDQIDSFLGRIQDIMKNDLNNDDIKLILTKFDKSEWFNLIDPMHSGWILHDSLSQGHSITKVQFAKWYLTEEDSQNLITKLNGLFSKVDLIERHDNYFRFKVPTNNMLLSEFFGKLEDNKKNLNIKEYSFAQTSLEQIFNEFASQQEEETGQVRGIN